MKFSLLNFNKILLLVAIVSLIYRRGNFFNSFIPKPFEIIFALLLLATAFYLVKDRKIKEFFISIPKNILVSSLLMVFSVLFGWLIGIFILNSTPNLNMVLEFGTFFISVSVFILTLFYSRDDEKYDKRYLYALLLPTVYIFFVFFAGERSLLFFDSAGKFLGLTLNPNIISKILLIPSLFFITYSLFGGKNRWYRCVAVIVSSSLLALLIWISSRGALLGLFLGAASILMIYVFKNYSWKKAFVSLSVFLLIFILGFGLAPNDRRDLLIKKLLISDTGYSLTLSTIISVKSAEQELEPTTIQTIKPTETRLQIWSFFLKRIIKNPFGIGPDTHISSGVIGVDGYEVSSGPHNTFLQIWLWGGWLSLMSFIYLVFSAFWRLKNKLNSDFNFYTLALIGILFSLTISIMFDDSLSFFWYWIILALSLRE